MSSFIENYCGHWKDTEGNQLDISRIDNKHLSIAFTRSGEDKPLKRPWFNNKQAVGMIGSDDQETDFSIDVELSDEGVGFYLNLCFDFTIKNLFKIYCATAICGWAVLEILIYSSKLRFLRSVRSQLTAARNDLEQALTTMTQYHRQSFVMKKTLILTLQSSRVV